jgi:hypothetical protein
MPVKRKRQKIGANSPSVKKPRQGELSVFLSFFNGRNHTSHVDKLTASPKKIPVASKQGACTRCKSRKVKCNYESDSVECQACVAARVQCVQVVAGASRPSTSQGKTRRSQSVASDCSRHSKSSESDYKTSSGMDNKHRASSSQPERVIGGSLLVWLHSSTLNQYIIDHLLR